MPFTVGWRPVDALQALGVIWMNGFIVPWPVNHPAWRHALLSRYRSLMSDIPIEHELIKEAAALVDLKVIDTQVEHFAENTKVRITMEEDPEVLESCALGLIFTLGVLSFHDARPRGVSADYADLATEWTVGDLLRHLRFPQGRISFYADYVHGRMMKTSIEISPDGRIVLETTNRGEAATRWVARLQGKKVMSLVGSPRWPAGTGDPE